MTVELLRKGSGQILVEGDEITELYCNTGKLCFAVGTLLPGQRSSVDEGHSEADEICYVAQGEIVVRIPDRDENYLLHEGDALLIRAGVAHCTINVGGKGSTVIWACAPRP